MASEVAALTDRFEDFLNTYYSEKIAQLAEAYPSRKSLEISYSDLEKFDTELADSLLENPDIMLKSVRQALSQMPVQVVPGAKFEPHVRVFGLPSTSLVMVESIGAAHIGKMIAVDCTVTRRGEIKPKVKLALLKCRRCDAIYKIPLEADSDLPDTCEQCKQRSLVQDEDESVFVDLQRSAAQEPLEHLRGGAPATSIELWVEDDLVNSFFPGQRLLVTGMLRIRPPPPSKSKGVSKFVYSKYLDVLHIQKVEKEFEEVDISQEDRRKILALSKDPEIYGKMVRSIAPSIYGHDEVKEALGLQLFGGTPDKETVDGGRIRNDIHVLLIGDPGAAKTRFLQYICRLAPKSMYVSGKSVTGTGLTAAAEKDELAEGGWTLKAGALVLASNGIAGVDEFDKIDDSERGAMHEVMESGTVSVAKAGIVARFNARTSILAAANPKFGRFDPNMYPAQQFEIPPTLLSRFDLIFPIRDIMDEERDKKTADHILLQHMLGGKKAKSKTSKGRSLTEIAPPLEMDFLRKYIAYARKYVQPELTDEANNRIKDFYVDLRRMGAQQGAVPITARYIEGLVRLSEASAKTRLSEKVELMDADRAIRLVDFVMKATMMDKSLGRIDSDIISVGKPKSYFDKQKNVLEIVRELEQEYEMVAMERVIEEARRYNIEEGECRRMIDELLRKTSDLYEPRHGFLKIVRPKVD